MQEAILSCMYIIYIHAATESFFFFFFYIAADNLIHD